MVNVMVISRRAEKGHPDNRMPFDFACSFFGVIGRVVSPVSSFLLLPVFSARAFFVPAQACWRQAEASGVADAQPVARQVSLLAQSGWAQGDSFQDDSAESRAGGFAAPAEWADSSGCCCSPDDYSRGDSLALVCFAEDYFPDGWSAASDEPEPVDLAPAGSEPADSALADLAQAGSKRAGSADSSAGWRVDSSADSDGLAAGSRAVRGGR
jgi:hypothetical protein